MECERIFLKRDDRWCKDIFLNEFGKRWMGKKCPACRTAYHIQYGRAHGSLPIDEIKYHSIKSGREAEQVVAQALREIGWTTKLTTARGPDIIACAHESAISIEVKRAKHAKKRNCWLTYPVLPGRRNDDYCAIYFPGIDKISIVAMTDHLGACSASGYRMVTKLRKQLADEPSRLFLPHRFGERAFTH